VHPADVWYFGNAAQRSCDARFGPLSLGRSAPLYEDKKMRVDAISRAA
jgi:hypothetical protein